MVNTNTNSNSNNNPNSTVSSWYQLPPDSGSALVEPQTSSVKSSPSTSVTSPSAQLIQTNYQIPPPPSPPITTTIPNYYMIPPILISHGHHQEKVVNE
jgi:hypothetical protein